MNINLFHKCAWCSMITKVENVHRALPYRVRALLENLREISQAEKKTQRKVDYKNYVAITMRRNYQQKLSEEIISRNYYRKLSQEIIS